MMKRAALLTDISGLGNCSGNVGVAVMSALGVEVCLVPTAVLSAQTGFKNHALIPLGGGLDELISSLGRISPRFDVLSIGFLANAAQAAAAEKLVRLCGSGARLVVDPIMGDGGRAHPFCSGEFRESVKRLALSADVITPNLTELCLLSGASYEELTRLPENEIFEAINDLCRSISLEKLKTVVVTGIDCGGDIANLTADENGFSVTRAKRFGGSMSGTGDILASVVAAAAAKGGDIHEAVGKAAQFISFVLENSLGEIEDRNYGIPYQQYLHRLIV